MGLWQGPEPEAIRVLTYTGRRILRLARVDACVKRVSPHVAPWATANERARPQYSTRNAVAFAQDPDAVVQVCCVEPEDLSKDLYVQFDGVDRSVVERDATLQVDLPQLRAAMWWFASHNWQWLQATKHQEVVGSEALGSRMEHVLTPYSVSLEGLHRGVPRELLEGATRVSADIISVNMPGPADAVAGGYERG